MIAKIIAGAIIVGAVGLGVHLFPRESQAPTLTVTPNDNQPSTDPSASQPASGSYVDYREGVIENTAGQKILFFHAPWCSQCRALEASIQKGPVPEGVTIIKVDYDSMQELRQKYGVTLQTTLVKVDDNGQLVEKYVAYSKPSLDALIENLL